MPRQMLEDRRSCGGRDRGDANARTRGLHGLGVRAKLGQLSGVAAMLAPDQHRLLRRVEGADRRARQPDDGLHKRRLGRRRGGLPTAVVELPSVAVKPLWPMTSSSATHVAAPLDAGRRMLRGWPCSRGRMMLRRDPWRRHERGDCIPWEPRGSTARGEGGGGGLTGRAGVVRTSSDEEE